MLCYSCNIFLFLPSEKTIVFVFIFNKSIAFVIGLENKQNYYSTLLIHVSMAHKTIEGAYQNVIVTKPK